MVTTNIRIIRGKWQSIWAMIFFLIVIALSAQKIWGDDIQTNVDNYILTTCVTVVCVVVGFGLLSCSIVNSIKARIELNNFSSAIKLILERVPFVFGNEFELGAYADTILRKIKQGSGFRQIILRMLGKNLNQKDLDNLIIWCYDNPAVVSDPENDILRDIRQKTYPTTVQAMFETIQNFTFPGQGTVEAICHIIKTYLVLVGYHSDMNPLAQGLIRYLHGKQLTRADISDEIVKIEECLRVHYGSINLEKRFNLLTRLHAINT